MMMRAALSDQGEQTGTTKQLYKGHGGPVTCIEFYPSLVHASPLLITGAWDKVGRTSLRLQSR